MKKTVLGIDPGLSGALVIFGGHFEAIEMPIINKNEINVKLVSEFVGDWAVHIEHIFLERALAFKMGRTSALNYGRGFGNLEAVSSLSGLPLTYVEPGKWTKVMHAGIKGDLKAKEKSLIAYNRLYKQYHVEIMNKGFVNRNGKTHDGLIDALLIADYGLRQL